MHPAPRAPQQPTERGTPRPTRDEGRIRALARTLTAAWNAGDAEAYAEVFTDDADYITFFGSRMQGRKAIEESHRSLFAGPLRGSRIGEASRGGTRGDIRFLTDDVALLVTTGGTRLAGATEPDPERDSIITLVAVRTQGDTWRFASFQNTRVSPPVSPPGRALPNAAGGGS